MRLTWKREPIESGLAGVVQGPRGYDLRLKGNAIGHVGPIVKAPYSYDIVGWTWYARDNDLGIPLKNTYKTPVATIEEAKAQCLAYVKECLAKTAEGGEK